MTVEPDRPDDGVAELPGHKALRHGRRCLPGVAYFLTLCTDGARAILTQPGVPEVLLGSLVWLEQSGKVEVHAYAVMPDHIHVMLRLKGQAQLGQVMGSVKKFTARRINDLTGGEGQVWEDGLYDHAVRNQDDYDTRMNYLWENPVRAGMVRTPEEWPWVSVHGLPG